MRVKGQKSGVMRIFQALLVSYIITGILLLVLAVLLYKLNLDKGKVTAGITGIYVVSAFAGGFFNRKASESPQIYLGAHAWDFVFPSAGTGLLWRISHPFRGDVIADRDDIGTVRRRWDVGRYVVIENKRCAAPSNGLQRSSVRLRKKGF